MKDSPTVRLMSRAEARNRPPSGCANTRWPRLQRTRSTKRRSAARRTRWRGGLATSRMLAAWRAGRIAEAVAALAAMGITNGPR